MIEEFIKELEKDTPSGVLNFLATQIGEIDEISAPSTTDEAVIACGQLAANLNNAWLKKFSGFTPVEGLMRIGQKNPVIISSLLSNLEFITASNKLTIISPTSGQEMTYEDLFACTGAGIESVTVTIDAGMEITLTQNGDVWSGGFVDELATDAELTATFAASFADGENVSKTVSFTIAENQIVVDSFPAKDASYSADTNSIDSVSVALDKIVDAQSVNVSLLGQTLSLKKLAGNTYVSESLTLSFDLLSYLGANVMLISIETADGTREQSINFELFTGEQPGEG